jgi:hypothetical protein
MTTLLTEPHISFGSGGGFTNTVKTFHLLEDGRIVEITKDSIHKDSISNMKTIANIGKKNAKACFTEMQTLKLDSLQFAEPGNLYYFINVKKDTSATENKVVWGSKDKPIPKEVHDFYKKLSAYLIPKVN